MKRTLLNITLASIATLVAYVFLYFIWGALLSGIESPKLKLVLIAGMTSLVYAFILLYLSKIRKGVGEEEVLSDYNGIQYTSVLNDMRVVLRSELRCIIAIWVINILCFALNIVDNILFYKNIISLPTFFFTPMTIFATCFDIEIIGYLLSAVFISVAYLFMLLIYRRQRYNYWTKKHE